MQCKYMHRAIADLPRLSGRIWGQNGPCPFVFFFNWNHQSQTTAYHKHGLKEGHAASVHRDSPPSFTSQCCSQYPWHAVSHSKKKLFGVKIRVEVMCLWFHINNSNVFSALKHNPFKLFHRCESTTVRPSESQKFTGKKNKTPVSPLISANTIILLSLPFNSKGNGFIRMLIYYAERISHLRGEQMTLQHVFCDLSYMSS